MFKIATVLRCNKMELYSAEPKNASPEFKLLRSLDKCGHRSDVRAVCISSDSLAVATGSGEAVKMWNRTSQSCLRSIDTGYVTSLTFVPGDRHLLAGLKSGAILILDIGTAEILEEVAAHQCEVWDICVTPDSVCCYNKLQIKSPFIINLISVAAFLPVETRRSSSGILIWLRPKMTTACQSRTEPKSFLCSTQGLFSWKKVCFAWL
jgi:WD40 repeat protein